MTALCTKGAAPKTPAFFASVAAAASAAARSRSIMRSSFAVSFFSGFSEPAAAAPAPAPPAGAAAAAAGALALESLIEKKMWGSFFK